MGLSASAWPTSDASVAEWGHSLIALVGRGLPWQVKGVQGNAIEQWPLVGPAYVARASGTLESMYLLLDARRTTDAIVLLRSLYENVLVFAWIDVDPPAHLSRWIKSACGQGIKADNDWTAIGYPILDAANKQYAEDKVSDAVVKVAPNKLDMAKSVDQHWNLTYPGHSQIAGSDIEFLTFAGLYRHVYRLGSQMAHQDPRGLSAFYTTDATGFTSIHLERPDKYSMYPWVIGNHVLTLGLAIASASLGSPEVTEVWAARAAALAHP